MSEELNLEAMHRFANAMKVWNDDSDVSHSTYVNGCEAAYRRGFQHGAIAAEPFIGQENRKEYDAWTVAIYRWRYNKLRNNSSAEPPWPNNKQEESA